MDPAQTPKSVDRLLRLPEVLQLVPVSRSAWYQGISEGRYPAGIKLSSRSVAWRMSDIEQLLRKLSGTADPQLI